MILFSHPKPFQENTTAVQRAAFRSWREVFPDTRIILFGREKGTEQVCLDLDLEYGGPVRVEPESGAALVSDIFQKIAFQQESLNMFINSDIILGERVARTLTSLRSQPGPWIASGRRYCLPPFDWECSVQTKKMDLIWASHPRWGHKTALDYFVWKDMDFASMPDFVIGHCAWDNWMVWFARMRNFPVYDLSREFPAFHFDHGYSYSRGNSSQTGPAGFLETYNLGLLGNKAKRFHLGHATHEVCPKGIKPRRGFAAWQREFEIFRLRKPAWEIPIRYFRQIFHPLIRFWERATDGVEDWDRITPSLPTLSSAPLQRARSRVTVSLRRIGATLGASIRGPIRVSVEPPGDVLMIDPPQCTVIPKSGSLRPCSHPYLGTRLQKYETTWVASLQGLEVYGPTIAVVDRTGALISSVSIEWSRLPQDNWTFRRLQTPPPENLPGKSLVLASTGGETYFHWMTNVLPRLQLVKEAGFDPESFDHILINQTAKPFQRETLARLGIPLERCRVFGQSPHGYRCETAVLPSLPEYPGNITPKTCRFLRSLYPFAAGHAGKRLYIGRPHHGKRVVVEQKKIIHFLSSLGFESQECSRLTVEEQARLFGSAEIIVIAHGAAATNLAFCRPGTKVIELFGPGYVNPCYRDLSAHLGLVYSAVIGNGPDWQIVMDHGHADSPITASLELLKETLHDLLPEPPVQSQKDLGPASQIPGLR